MQKESPSEKPDVRSTTYKLLTPRNWSLRTRLVYTTGTILLLGAILTLASISYTIQSRANDTISRELENYRHLITTHLNGAKQYNRTVGIQLSNKKTLQTALLENDQQVLEDITQFFFTSLRQFSMSHRGSIQYYTKTGTPILPPAYPPIENSETDHRLLSKVMQTGTEASDIQYFGSLFAISSIIPVLQGENTIGFIEFSTFFDYFYNHLQLDTNYGLALVTFDKNKNSETPQPAGQGPGYDVVEKYGRQCPNGIELNTVADKVHTCEDLSYIFYPIPSETNEQTGYFVLFFDGSQITSSIRTTILVISLMTIVGVVLLSISLYMNVKRIRDFFKQMKKVLIASHSNDFRKTFDTETVHCLDVLQCGHKECPVYRDPSRVCYLETGDEAISPKYRSICIQLNKYTTCKNCPVYKLHHGDELKEMRHVINTMMRLWSDFLGSVGNLLGDVLGADASKQPSLDDVSGYLKQMASLTTYSRDIQGVYNKEEVYQQLEWVFERHFGLKTFNLLQVNASENRLEQAINRDDLTTSHFEVFFTCQMCRCLRVSEDVISLPNPHICPHIGIDPSTQVRCCLPMVMGGRVGAVFTFVVDRNEWEHKKKDIIIIKKYLEETAPILSSLNLLQISKEQALKDPLTLCHNRRFMDEYLAQMEKQNQRNKRNVGFIMADLDHFKMVNDEFGHLAGDDILKQLADLIRQTIRKSDLLIRYGGEEFLVILLDVKKEGVVEEVAEKIRRNIEETTLQLPSGGGLKKTLSMGVSEFPADGEQLYQVIKYADVALYQAKEQGRNRVVRFNENMWKTEEY